MEVIRITTDLNGVLLNHSQIHGGYLVAGSAASSADLYNGATSFGKTPRMSFKAVANAMSPVVCSYQPIPFSEGVSVRMSPVASPSLSPSASGSPACPHRLRSPHRLQFLQARLSRP